jgi:hypothetical protein
MADVAGSSAASGCIARNAGACLTVLTFVGGLCANIVPALITYKTNVDYVICALTHYCMLLAELSCQPT